MPLKLQIDIKKTGMKIRFLCKERNISVKDIQRELCIGAFQSVYDWFSGKSLPSLDNFFRLSRLLNVKMEDMIETVVEPKALPLFVDIEWQRVRAAMRCQRLLMYAQAIQLQTE